MINVLVSGMTGMTILVFYHPNFLIYNALLLGGFALVAVVAGQGGVLATRTVSEKNYDVMTWIQDIANNRLHFKASQSTPFLIGKTDRLLDGYLQARQVRSNILTWRQYRSIIVWEAVCHSGMIALGGWLLSIGQVTLGQFVAAEVIVGTLLLNLDTVTRRIYAMTYILTSLGELDRVFALPKHEALGLDTSTWLRDSPSMASISRARTLPLPIPTHCPSSNTSIWKWLPGKNWRCWYGPASRSRRWLWCSLVSPGRPPESSGTMMSTFAT